MKTKILVVDDEPDIVEFIQYNLENEGYSVVVAYNGKNALELMEEYPDLIVLDVMMPEMDGLEFTKLIRKDKRYKKTPILFLTAKTSEQDEIIGLDSGADDYISKPVPIKKLIARIKANIRQSGKHSDDNVEFVTAGIIEIDRREYIIKLNGKKIIFPRKEFEIIFYMAQKPGEVISREELLNAVWGKGIYVGGRTVDVHVRKIREKLGEFSAIIETVKGVGYRFKVHK
jgi:two-component system alkaline phosphatase synthesis response regulator PhoP